MRPHTKIVATLGPATDAPGVLTRMIAAGVDVVRLGLAHGTLEEHQRRIAAVRGAADDQDRPIAVIADLPGPKIRVGDFGAEGVYLNEDAAVELCTGDDPSTDSRIHVDHPTVIGRVERGAQVVLGDGAVVLEVERPAGDQAQARVVRGGRVQGRPGIHFRGAQLGLSAPTEDDLALLSGGIAETVDMVAASFVRRPDDLAAVRYALDGTGALVVAKIETAEAVENLDEIVREADAVMVARGDLGIRLPMEDVPHIQKRIIRRGAELGRPVITATQMLESMIHAPLPTRAEVSDVANAVLDGSDALMLSGETAIGHDPVSVVTAMADIARRAEQERYRGWNRMELPDVTPVHRAMAHAAFRAAADASASAILCHTRSGTMGRALAALRPEPRLVAFSPEAQTVRQLNLSWGIHPLLLPEQPSTEHMVRAAVEAARAAGHVATGDVVAVLVGAPAASEPVANVLRLLTV